MSERKLVPICDHARTEDNPIPSEPKPPLPMGVLEDLSTVTQQTRRILDGCVEPGFPFPAILLDWKRVTQIMKASAIKRYAILEEFYRSHPQFRPEWLEETVEEVVEETFESVPMRFRIGSRLQEHGAAIREELNAELRSRNSAQWVEPGRKAGVAETIEQRQEKANRADRAARRQAVVNPILKKKRWKRGRLATAAAVGKNSVYDYLDGTRVRITEENRKALAEALGIEPEKLPD